MFAARKLSAKLAFDAEIAVSTTQYRQIEENGGLARCKD